MFTLIHVKLTFSSSQHFNQLNLSVCPIPCSYWRLPKLLNNPNCLQRRTRKCFALAERKNREKRKNTLPLPLLQFTFFPAACLLHLGFSCTLHVAVRMSVVHSNSTDFDKLPPAPPRLLFKALHLPTLPRLLLYAETLSVCALSQNCAL